MHIPHDLVRQIQDFSAISGDLAQHAETRLKLAVVELQLEVVRAKRRLWLGLGLSAALLLALLQIHLAMVVVFWDSPYRIVAAVLPPLALLLVAAGAAIALRAHAAKGPLLAATRAELREDWATLRAVLQ